MFITEFTPSVVRAGIMGILILGAKIIYRKLDFATSISLSLLCTLLNNPYNIWNLGLQLSYLGTIGIVLLSRTIEDKIKFKSDNKIISMIKETIIVCISAQLMIFPIIAFNFNTISTFFLISNLLVSPLIGIIIILGFISIFISYFSMILAQVISIPLNLSIQILTKIAQTISQLPFSTFITKTPFIFNIVLYYTILSIYIFTKRVKHRVIKLLILKNRTNIKNIFTIFIIITLLTTIYIDIPKEFSIYFIDVGQGDSTLIRTKNGTTILIDGGGNEQESHFDVGEKTLLPYLLDRRIKKIDYILFSHFDSDHCKRFIYNYGKARY